MLKTKLRWTASLALLGMVAFVAGCGDGDATPKGTAGGGDSTPAGDTSDHDHHDHEKDEAGGHNLDGWWCTAHGVPEGECTRCDSSLIAAFKQKSDWCEKHDLPESQCFTCDPKRANKFIARYEAKFGKKPPLPTE